MQKQGWQSRLLCVLSIVIITGCAGSVSQEVQQAVKQARAHFEVVEELNAQNTFPDDYQEARDRLSEAEKYLASSRQKQKAKQPAEQSVSASQRILRKFYRTTLTPLLRQTKAEIEAIIEEDPDNPLQDFLPRLNDLLEYSDQLTHNAEPLTLERVLADLDEAKAIQENVERNIKTTLESDVSFDTGKYELSAKGKQLLDSFFEQLIQHPQSMRQASMMMKIKIVGYTDQQDFRRGTDLFATLVREIGADLPTEPVARRRALNQRLSQLRAQSIARYLRHRIDQSALQPELETELLGRGETLPPGVTPAYAPTTNTPDSRRRICKVYGYIISKPSRN